MHLKDKNIVITGGTSGIGLETVRHLHAGNRLIVIASSPERLQNLAAEFSGTITCRADLGEPEGIEAAARAVRERFDCLDLLINNAAIQYTPGFLDANFQYESIGREIAVNFTAVCGLTARLLPILVHDTPAAIVNVNSGLALAPKASSAVYCATKGAMDLFTRSLRYQLADTNVAVLQAFMPMVDTPMTEGRGNGKLSAAVAAERLLDGIERGIGDHYIGKVKLLRAMMAFAPWLGRRIMKRS